jgi:hypothetical protein
MAHPPADALELLSEERAVLEEIASSPSLSYRAVRESKGLLLAADGVANSVIADRLGVSRSTVLEWRQHFVEHGVEWVGRWNGWAGFVRGGAASPSLPRSG